MSEPAQLLNWITCDAVHVDPATGKHYLLGCFANLRARQFPATHPRMVWFLTLTGLLPGTHRLRISMGLSMESLKPIIDRPFTARHPNDRINLVNNLRNFRFEEAGTYPILIEVDEDPILVTSLTLSS